MFLCTVKSSEFSVHRSLLHVFQLLYLVQESTEHGLFAILGPFVILSMSVREKVFVRKSRQGNVQVIAREHYLREDLSCGALNCPKCQAVRYTTFL